MAMLAQFSLKNRQLCKLGERFMFNVKENCLIITIDPDFEWQKLKKNT